MAEHIESDNAVKKVHGMLAEKYGDYVTHSIDCASVDQALGFFRRLSFVSGTSADDIQAPSNILLSVTPHPDCTFVIVGGQLTSDQNYEVRRLADELRIRCHSMCVANEGTLARREFLDAAARLKGWSTPEPKSATEKKWWKIWQ